MNPVVKFVFEDDGQKKPGTPQNQPITPPAQRRETQESTDGERNAGAGGRALATIGRLISDGFRQQVERVPVLGSILSVLRQIADAIKEKPPAPSRPASQPAASPEVPGRPQRPTPPQEPRRVPVEPGRPEPRPRPAQTQPAPPAVNPPPASKTPPSVPPAVNPAPRTPTRPPVPVPPPVPAAPVGGAAGGAAGGAGGAAAGAAGGAAIAGAVATVGAAVVVLAAGVIAVKALAVANEKFAERVDKLAGELRPFSAAIQSSQARIEIAKLRLDIERAQKLGDRVGRAAEAEARLERAASRIITAIEGPILDALTPLAEIAAVIGEKAVPVLGLAGQAFEVAFPGLVALQKTADGIARLMKAEDEKAAKIPPEADILGIFREESYLPVTYNGRTFNPSGPDEFSSYPNTEVSGKPLPKEMI